MERRICIEGASSEAIFVLGIAILAGSRFGPAFLRVALTRTLDAWAAKWPYMSLSFFIDDLGIQSRGAPRIIFRFFPRAVQGLIKELEGAGARGGQVGGCGAL